MTTKQWCTTKINTEIINSILNEKIPIEFLIKDLLKINSEKYEFSFFTNFYSNLSINDQCLCNLDMKDFKVLKDANSIELLAIFNEDDNRYVENFEIISLNTRNNINVILLDSYLVSDKAIEINKSNIVNQFKTNKRNESKILYVNGDDYINTICIEIILKILFEDLESIFKPYVTLYDTFLCEKIVKIKKENEIINSKQRTGYIINEKVDMNLLNYIMDKTFSYNDNFFKKLIFDLFYFFSVTKDPLYGFSHNSLLISNIGVINIIDESNYEIIKETLKLSFPNTEFSKNEIQNNFKILNFKNSNIFYNNVQFKNKFNRTNIKKDIIDIEDEIDRTTGQTFKIFKFKQNLKIEDIYYFDYLLPNTFDLYYFMLSLIIQPNIYKNLINDKSLFLYKLWNTLWLDDDRKRINNVINKIMKKYQEGKLYELLRMDRNINNTTILNSNNIILKIMVEVGLKFKYDISYFLNLLNIEFNDSRPLKNILLTENRNQICIENQCINKSS